MIQFARGLDIDYFLEEGDYAIFIETHLMPPLTSIRGGEGMRAPVAKREPEYPELPTALTCWGYTGEAYQIPIESAAVGHRYVSAPDAPPAPPGYTEDLLELLASFGGMLLRREALLGFHNIQVLLIPTSPTTTAPGPSVPPPEARRERQAPTCKRGRARSTRADSSETESSDDSGSGSASGSDNGANGDSFESPPKKRKKRASRA
ncbi:hypothetical protein CsSME_00011253 [Camellia sinensis var. sinensis]